MIRYLNEDNRNDLISRSRNGDNYKDQSHGKNRYQRRLLSRISKSVQEYNDIDMNKLFDNNIIDITLRIIGETDEYFVKLSWGGFLTSLRAYTKDLESDNIEQHTVVRALADSFNNNDVFIHCTCEDWKYRMDYWAHKNDIASTQKTDDPQDRASDITNPNDTKGAGCKHSLLVLNNTSWILKVGSVITNYIKYMKYHYPKQYSKSIYPALFDREFTGPEPLDATGSPDTEDNLPTDTSIIDTSNIWAKTKNQFKPGNQYRIKPTASNAQQDDKLDNTYPNFNYDSLMSDR